MLIDRINEIARARAGSLSRRAFIKVGAAAGGGLLLSVGLPVFRGDAEAATDVFAPDAFIRIDTSGQVTMVMPQVEMGQGTYTSIPMLIAEELEVELATVQLEHAPPNDKLYANPLIGVQVTGGSTSIRGFWEPLRRAGATARNMLISAAARPVGRGGERLPGREGRGHPCGQRPQARLWRAGGEGRGAAGAGEGRAQGPEGFHADRHAGQAPRHARPRSMARRCSASIRKLPGMKIATVAISPVFGGKLAKVDDSKALAVKGVRQVVKLDDAVAVVADHMGAAKKGMEALEITWDEGANAKLSTGDILQQLESGRREAGRGRHQGGRCREGAGGCCQEDRGELSHALPGPCRHGADELHGACDQGFLRGLGRDPGHDKGAGHGRRGHRPAAGEGAGAQPSAGRRLRPAARYRWRHSGGPDRQAGRWPGEGGLDPRGGYPARHLPALLLRPARRGARCDGRARGLASSRRRLLHPGALVSRRPSRTVSIPTRWRAPPGLTAFPMSWWTTSGRSRRRASSPAGGGASASPTTPSSSKASSMSSPPRRGRIPSNIAARCWPNRRAAKAVLDLVAAKSGWGEKLPAGQRPRRLGALRLRQLHRRSGRGRRRQGRPGPGEARDLRRRLRRRS